jgi:hypothetical protein
VPVTFYGATALAQPWEDAQPQHFISAQLGLGVSTPLEDVDGSGVGGYGQVEYIYRYVEWATPRAYVGALITGSNSDCGANVAPCEVSANIAFLGVKLRLLAPIPYVAPFVELGVGGSVGALRTRVDGWVDESKDGVTYHIPVGLGLALGSEHEYELSFQYLVHPRERNLGGAFAFGLTFALDAP